MNNQMFHNLFLILNHLKMIHVIIPLIIDHSYYLMNSFMVVHLMTFQYFLQFKLNYHHHHLFINLQFQMITIIYHIYIMVQYIKLLFKLIFQINYIIHINLSIIMLFHNNIQIIFHHQHQIFHH